MNRDTEYGIKQVACICQNAGAGTISSADIDTRDSEAADFIISRGEESGDPTSWTLDVKIQERDAAGSYTDVTGAAIVQLTEDSEALAIAIIHLKTVSRKRYLKVVAVLAMTAGTTPKLPINVNCALSSNREVPVTQSVAAIRVGDVASL